MYSYLHNSDPPIIHDDLSCDTIYIQHNGLIKIGSIAPDIVNNHVKTCVDLSKFLKNMHYMAPEIHESGQAISAINASEQQNTNGLKKAENLAENLTNQLTTSTNNTISQQSNQSQSINTTTINIERILNALKLSNFLLLSNKDVYLEFGGNGDTHPVTPELEAIY